MTEKLYPNRSPQRFSFVGLPFQITSRTKDIGRDLGESILIHVGKLNENTLT